MFRAALERMASMWLKLSNPAFLWQEICRMKDHYFIYQHRMFFVLGLIFSCYLTESAVINVLMWYLTFHGGDLVISAILTIFHGSLSLMLMIITSNVAYMVAGRFATLLLCYTAYIVGLMIFRLFAPFDVKWVVVVALVLLAFGRSGSLILQELLFDLIDGIDNSQDRTRERSFERTEMVSRLANVLASICSLLFVAPDALAQTSPTWNRTFLACIIVKIVFLITFVIGFRYYPQERLTERSCGPFLRVLLAGIQRCFVNPTRQEGSPRLDTTEQEARWNEDQATFKKHLQLFPMWLVYLVVSLILGTGFTFFYEQYSNLDTENIPVQIYSSAFRFSEFGIPWLYSRIKDRKTDKLKIGLGLLCAIISCVFAWKLEVRRLDLVQNLDSDSENTSLSFLWLVPQFCFLGGMYGLTDVGWLNFRSHDQYEGIRSHRHEFMIFLQGIAYVISIFLILIIQRRGWLGHSINTSRLDKYFKVLACLCLATFVIYCCIATMFYKDNDSQDNEVSSISGSQQDHNHAEQSLHNQELLNNGDSQQDHKDSEQSQQEANNNDD